MDQEGIAANITPQRIETVHLKVTELEHSVDRCLSSNMDQEGIAANITPQRIETVHLKVTELEHSVDRCLSSNMDQEGIAANITPQRIETVHLKVTELEHSVDRCLSSNMDQEGIAANITPQRIETVHLKVTELEHSVDRCLSSNMDQELRLQLLERATYNGILIWKIDDFEWRRKEAVDGVTMSLYSSPFYTSRHGYKMCARIYLNGDGLGKNTHFSFFFVIMRGPYDALLPWPFRQKVTLALLNQTGKKHVTDHFRPDPHSSSFQRPGKREMNIASGCPMFIRIEHLLNGGFVKDDTAFIRIIVDTSDLPKIIPS